MLVIRRLDQWAGKAVRYKLLLDGQASAKIKNGEKLEIRPSTMGSHEIAVSYEILGILLFESEAIRFNYDGSNIDFECGTSGDQPYLKLLGSEDAEVPLVTPESEKKLQPADYQSSERKGVMQKLTIKGVFTVAVTGYVFLLLAFRLFGGEQDGSDYLVAQSVNYADVDSDYYQDVCALPQGALTNNDRLLDVENKARDEKKMLLAANNEVAFNAWYGGKAKWSWRNDLIEEVNKSDKNIQCHINSDEPKKCYLVDRNGRSRGVANSINLDFAYNKAKVSLNDPNPLLDAKLSSERVSSLVSSHEGYYASYVRALNRGDSRSADGIKDQREWIVKKLRRHRDAVSFEQRQKEGDLDQQFFPELEALATARLTAKQNLETPKPVKWFNVIINSPASSFRWGDRNEDAASGPVLEGRVREAQKSSSPLMAPYKPAVVWYREMTSRNSCVTKS